MFLTKSIPQLSAANFLKKEEKISILKLQVNQRNVHRELILQRGKINSEF